MPIARVKRELDDTVTIHLAPGSGSFRFAPGQFNMLYLFGMGEVAISISGDPARTRELVHTIRAVGSVTRPLTALRRGATIGVRGPYGTSWPVDSARGKDVIVVAGGLGLAPLRPAILHLLRERRSYRRVVVLYGARAPEDMLYRKELEGWRGRLDAHVDVTVDRAGIEWRGHVGVVTQLVARLDLDPAMSVAFVCGPEVMMRFVSRSLVARGVAPEAIHVSLERNMKCGVGWCGHCQLGPFFVCKDGPVMSYQRVARLLTVREL
jgi:NAD(P)H-flavin reductase